MLKEFDHLITVLYNFWKNGFIYITTMHAHVPVGNCR